KRLEELKNTRVDTSVLLALEAWYQGDENMQHHITELEAQMQKNRHELAQIAEVFEKKTLAIDVWEADLMQKETDLNNRFASLQQEENHVKEQENIQNNITELEAQIQKNRHKLAQIAEVFEKQTLAIDE